MAVTKIDPQLSAIIKTIISTDKMDDFEKENYRRLAKEAMQVYSRRRVFGTVVKTELIVGGTWLFLTIILLIVSRFSVNTTQYWGTFAFFETVVVVFSILNAIFRARFRARVANLSGEFNAKVRIRKDSKFPVVPMVCLVGPFKSSYLMGIVTITSVGRKEPIPSYSNLNLTFFENKVGGSFTVNFRNKYGSFSLKPNECVIIVASISHGAIIFSKIPISMPASAFEETPKPIPQQTAPAVQTPKEPEEDSTPLGLITTVSFDKLGSFFSIPKNHVGFFVSKGSVYDMLKAGDYPLNIDDYPRLKSADPYAFKRIEPGDCPDIIMMDTESEFELSWKFDDAVHAKGSADFKISNPRLFLNFVFEENLLSDAKFDAFVRDTLKPLIIKKLKATKADDIAFAESELRKSIDGALDRMGLHIEHIGLSSFWKEEDDTPSETVEHCIHCGKELPEGSMFCPYCGQKQDSGVCPNCGAKLPAGAKFCAQCGTKIE